MSEVSKSLELEFGTPDGNLFFLVARVGSDESPAYAQDLKRAHDSLLKTLK